MLGVKGRIFVDSRCGIIEEDHIRRDKGSDHLAKTIGEHGKRVRTGKFRPGDADLQGLREMFRN